MVVMVTPALQWHLASRDSQQWGGSRERLIRCFVAEREKWEAVECQEEERIAKFGSNQSLVNR